MKQFVFAAMSLGLFTAGANATTEFIGAACITTSNAACVAADITVGTCANLEYMPPGLGNGFSTRISMFVTVEGFSNIAINHTLASGTLIGTTFKSVNATRVLVEGGDTYISQMKLPTHSPLSSTTTSVSFTGNIGNFNNVTGCTIGIRGSGVKRP